MRSLVGQEGSGSESSTLRLGGVPASEVTPTHQGKKSRYGQQQIWVKKTKAVSDKPEMSGSVRQLLFKRPVSHRARKTAPFPSATLKMVTTWQWM